jgi:hypothetical protein
MSEWRLWVRPTDWQRHSVDMSLVRLLHDRVQYVTMDGGSLLITDAAAPPEGAAPEDPPPFLSYSAALEPYVVEIFKAIAQWYDEITTGRVKQVDAEHKRMQAEIDYLRAQVEDYQKRESQRVDKMLGQVLS